MGQSQSYEEFKTSIARGYDENLCRCSCGSGTVGFCQRRTFLLDKNLIINNDFTINRDAISKHLLEFYDMLHKDLHKMKRIRSIFFCTQRFKLRKFDLSRCKETFKCKLCLIITPNERFYLKLITEGETFIPEAKVVNDEETFASEVEVVNVEFYKS